MKLKVEVANTRKDATAERQQQIEADFDRQLKEGLTALKRDEELRVTPPSPIGKDLTGFVQFVNDVRRYLREKFPPPPSQNKHG